MRGIGCGSGRFVRGLGRWCGGLGFALALALSGCAPKDNVSAPKSESAVQFPTTLDGLLKFLNTFPPVQTLHGKVLAERGDFYAAMKARGAFGMQEVKDQKVADKVESVEKWTVWGGISLFVVVAVALALIVKFPAKWQLLLSLAGVFGTLGTLSFVFGRYAAFLVGGGWVLIPLILAGVAWAIYRNWATVKAKAEELELSAQALVLGVAGAPEGPLVKKSVLYAARGLMVEGAVDALVQRFDPPAPKAV